LGRVWGYEGMFGSLNIKTIGGRLSPHGRRGICTFLREINGPLNVDAMLLTLRHTTPIGFMYPNRHLRGSTLDIPSARLPLHLVFSLQSFITCNFPRFSAYPSTCAIGTQLHYNHGTAHHAEAATLTLLRDDGAFAFAAREAVVVGGVGGVGGVEPDVHWRKGVVAGEIGCGGGGGGAGRGRGNWDKDRDGEGEGEGTYDLG